MSDMSVAKLDLQAMREMVLKTRPDARMYSVLELLSYDTAMERFKLLYKTLPTWLACPLELRRVAVEILLADSTVNSQRCFVSPLKMIVDTTLPRGAWYLLASPSQIVYSERT